MLLSADFYWEKSHSVFVWRRKALFQQWVNNLKDLSAEIEGVPPINQYPARDFVNRKYASFEQHSHSRKNLMLLAEPVGSHSYFRLAPTRRIAQASSPLLVFLLAMYSRHKSISSRRWISQEFWTNYQSFPLVGQIILVFSLVKHDHWRAGWTCTTGAVEYRQGWTHYSMGAG